jgi:hypothetical protein
MDGCMIMLPLKKTEQKCAEAWAENKSRSAGFQQVMTPNRVTHIIKGRNNKYDRHIKIYQYVDFGTCRYYDCFVTDKDNNPIEVEKLYIGGNFEE